MGGTDAASGGDGSGNDGQVMVDGVAPIQAVMDGVAQVMRKESASSADGSFAQSMRNLTEQIIDLVDNKDTADDAKKGEEKNDDKNTAATKGSEKKIDDQNTGDDETFCEDTILEDDDDSSQSRQDLFGWVM